MDNFWHRVEKTDYCWIWQGWKHKDGYGVITRDKKDILAHRYAYATCFGPIPDGVKVLHECDNPPCVNPAHLFLGTQEDNVRDMVSKGRQYRPTGTKNPRAKLTPAIAAEIRSKYIPRKNLVALAREYDIGVSTAWHVVSGETWKEASNG